MEDIMNGFVMDQQLYSSGQRGFTTLAASAGLSIEDKLELEKRSIYQLPGSLVYNEDSYKPEKLVFYRLNDDRYVIGRAIDFGKDRLGRPGNYLFHNLIVRKGDLVGSRFNPARLARAMMARSLFANALPDNKVLERLEYAVDNAEEHMGLRLIRDPELNLAIFHTCLDGNLSRNPIVVQGSQEDMLDFLEWLFSLLPYQIREQISFDTFGYNSPSGFSIIGLPADKSFARDIPHSINISLLDNTYQLNIDIYQPSHIARYIASMATDAKLGEAEAFSRLQHDLRVGDIEGFDDGFKAASEDVKAIIIAFNKQEVLQGIASGGCWSILPYLFDNLDKDDIDYLAVNPKLLLQLVTPANQELLDVLATWLLSSPQGRDHYFLLFNSPDLWKTFLKKLERSTVSGTDLMIKILELLQQQQRYSSEYEMDLYSYLFPKLSQLRANHRHAASLAKALSALPAAGLEKDGAMVNLLRYGAVLSLTSDSRILAKLLHKDLSRLPRSYLPIITSIVLEESFKTYKDEELSRAVTSFFRRSGDKAVLLEQLMSLEAPRRNIETQWNMAASLLEKMPRNPDYYRLKGKLAQVSILDNSVKKPGRSLFRKGGRK
jgi:hypothetical protein